MFKVIHKDTILYKKKKKKDAREHLFIEAEKHSMEFWQEISRYGRIDFIFYRVDNENEFDVFTIIKD